MRIDHSTAPSDSLPVPEFDSYRATLGGRILIFRCGAWRPMRPFENPNGYLQVKLRSNGRRLTRFVHNLVLFAFIGPRPDPGMHGCHKDGNRKNNRLSNLRWDTPQGNADDTIRHGRTTRGSRAHAAKLTEAHVAEIRIYAALGLTPKDVAKLWHISECHASSIVAGRYWKHVPAEI